MSDYAVKIQVEYERANSVTRHLAEKRAVTYIGTGHTKVGAVADALEKYAADLRQSS